MKVNSQYETEISLKDLVFHILYKWRIILLIGLIAAGIIGFREYWSFAKYHRQGELTPSEIQYEADIEANQQAIARAETDVAGYEKTIQGLIRYRDTSAIMKMDPRNIWTAEKKYYLNVKENAERDGQADSESADRILAVLSEAIPDDSEGENLIELFGTDDWKDIKEVVSVIANRDLRTISVIGCGSTKEEAEKRKEFADQYLIAKNKELQKTAHYSLEEISDHVGTSTVLTTKNANGEREEKDLAVIQNEVNENIREYRNQQNTYIGTLNNLKSRSFIKPAPKTMSQVIFGFALGTLTTVFLLLLMYLFNGKVKTAKEMQKRYDLFLLGEFTHSRAWWKGKGLDWVLEKLEFGKKTDFDNELDNIAFLIDEAKDGKTLLLTGTPEEKRLKKVYEGLASRLKEKGIELVLEPDYLHNSEAVAASRDLDSVLLVEEKYTSRIRDLNRVAEMLEIEDANVIGAVLL